MREYVWYSPELDIFTFQIIMEGCYISFEIDIRDAIHINHTYGNDIDPLYRGTWIPLGEL